MSILIIIMLAIFLTHCALCEDYYTVCQQQTVCQQTVCQTRGRYLTSIHNSEENSVISQICECNECWIGLQIIINDNNTTMQWTDNTDIDLLLIRQYLNNSLIKYNKSVYYGYIDKINNYWSITNNYHSPKCAVCGPQRFDPTHKFWLMNALLPAICFVIGLMYSLYLTVSLPSHLYNYKYNWLLEPKPSVKISAILLPALFSMICIFGLTYSIMLYTAYKKTYLMPPANMFDDDYPAIWMQTGMVGATALILYFIYIPMGYTHILLRLKQKFDNNPIMETVLPSKRCYSIIWVFIVIYCINLPIYPIVNKTMSYADGETKFKFTIVIVQIVLEFAINIILLFLYIKGLHTFSHQHYFRSDVAEKNAKSPIIDDKQHELMIEATRYTVLFLFVSVLNVAGLIVVVLSYLWMLSYRFIIFVGSVYIKDIVLLMAIHLSFKFNHVKYEKRCKYCDILGKNCCHMLSKKRSAKGIKEWHEQTNPQSVQKNNNIPDENTRCCCKRKKYVVDSYYLL